MDGDEVRRRHYGQRNYPYGYRIDTQEREDHAPSLPNDQSQARYSSGGDSERYEQSHLITTTQAAVNSPDVAGYVHSQGGQYTAAQMPPPSFPYQHEYAQATRQQPLSNLAAHMAYNVPQQPQATSLYEAVPQYHMRQLSAVDLLPSHFEAPQYHPAGEESGSLGSSISSQQFAPAPFQEETQYNPPSDLERSNLTSPYTNVEAEIWQDPATRLQNQELRGPGRPDQIFYIYDLALRRTNENTSRGKLVEALDSLQQLTKLLLTKIEFLGLANDVEHEHEERLKFWDNFNLCWLAFLTRQEDNTRKKHANLLPEDENVVPVASLEDLGDELTDLLDPLHKIGLVDYSMGVSEEEIITMLLKCVKLLQREEESTTSGSAARVAPTD